MLLALVGILFSLANASTAAAMPSLPDYWRLSCAPDGGNMKALARARQKAQAGGGDLKQGLAILDLACITRAMERRRFDVALKKFQEQGGKGAEPRPDHQQSTGIVRSAKARLEAATKKGTDLDATYGLGLALALLGDAWAVNRLDDVARIGAGTDIGARATLALAEFLFDTKGAAAANDYYRKALNTKNQFVIAYARYKLSWIDYIGAAQARNRERQKQAITQLARLSKQLAGARGGTAGGLARVVRDDLLNFVVDYGDPAEAQRILKAAGAAQVYAAFLEMAAYQRVEANQLGEAYKLFALAVKEQPNGPNALQMSINMTSIAAQMKNIPLVVSNLKGLANTYLNEKSPRRKRMKPKERRKVDQQLESLLFDYATAMDQQARGDGQPNSFKAADELYELFVKAFPKSGRLYEVRYYQGQLLYVQKRYLESAKALHAMITSNPKGKFTKEALEIMVTAAQTAIDADKRQYNLPAPGTIKKKIKIPELKKVYAECLDLFVKFMPQTPNSPAMRFVSASVYYDFGHYPDAVKRYMTYMRSSPSHEFAKIAAARVFEYYKIQGSEESYESAKAKIRAIQPLGSSPELAPYFAEKKKPKEADALAKEGKRPKAKDRKGAKKRRSNAGPADGDDSDGTDDMPASGEMDDAGIAGDAPSDDTLPATDEMDP